LKKSKEKQKPEGEPLGHRERKEKKMNLLGKVNTVYFPL
jgi:hypothetical protein